MDGRSRTQLFDELAVVGKALGSPRRLELMELLAQGERTVDALAKTVGAGVSSVSAHLQVLKMAHLVVTRREGTRIYYRLAGDDVAVLYASLEAVARTRSADVAKALAAYLGVPEGDETGTVTSEELLDLFAQGQVTLIDVRPAEEYAAGHLPGAVSVPLADLAGAAERLARESDIVAYCRGSFCVMAHDAVRLLGARGVPARRLEQGLLEWRGAGRPVECTTAVAS